jgi:flagellin
MSLRVNTNVSAMNALRNVGATNHEFARSINRLSTGLRINSAADDPAGLIISENFRAQISGIEQAIKNSQDAMNYAKTAEGALDEVNRLLRDARSLAVAAGNTGTLSEAQIQANQSQLNSIMNSISRIAETTQFGTKKLLDGSAGVYASVTSGANVENLQFSGSFNGAAITTNSVVTIQVTTAAERAIVTGSRTFAAGTTTVAAGSFTINGRTFNTTSTDTILDVINRINSASDVTGVTAAWTAGAGVVLRSKEYGAAQRVDLADSNGILLTAAGTMADAGVDAIADVVIDMNGTAAGGLATVSFASGTGLTLRDTTGNVIRLTENGNLNAAATAVGQLNVGSANFQIGANAGQTTTMSLRNFSASELGKGVVASKNLANLDLTNASGANDAIRVIDAAISEVAGARGEIGSFHRNVVESNIRALGIARENLSASESSIRDTDVASEMTQFTKLQILQQAGLSVLAQANAAPQQVLALLRG